LPPATHPALFWFRRDLRCDDNAGLHAALTAAARVHCVFVFDREILDGLADRADRRVDFIHRSVRELDAELRARGGGLIVLHDAARTAIPSLARTLGVHAVFANGDYEPQAVQRDAAIANALAAEGRKLHLAKDQAVFEKDEVLTQAGRPYTVFTPYRNAWLKRLEPFYVEPFDVAKHASRLAAPPFPAEVPSLESLGFEATDIGASEAGAGTAAALRLLDRFEERIAAYKEARDIPAAQGTSMLSVHNRFGTVSVRELVRRALRHDNEGARTWLSEITWRDFYFQVLWHHPRAATESFRAEYARLQWPNDPRLFAAWREARTGYPIVDAAMRQLETTGFMHNRLRMVVASFLCKDLLVDWRLGERHFAARLNDYDLAANNGGWQWAASTGCDAQPYFRIFNPVSQSEKFDPQGRFIRAFLPALARVPDTFIHAPWTMPPLLQQEAGCVVGRDYPGPVVDHATQREKALALYGRARA
jgi:deoxyribodipyrimidine photo-lyase